MFSGLLRTVAPLIRRDVVALGKRALTTGAQFAGDVVAGKNVKKAAKRRATVAGRILMQSLLNTPPPPGKRVKRIKRAAPRRRVTPNDDSEHTWFRNMAFVHRQSCDGVKSELDLFAVPPMQTSIEYGRWVEHQHLTSLDSVRPITEFVIPGTGDAYLDIANIYLLIRTKVVRGVGTDLAADTPVAHVNNWLHSLLPSGRVPERHARDALVEYLTISRLRRYRTELRRRGEEYSTHKPAVVQGHRRTHGCHDRGWWQYMYGLTTKVQSGESSRRDDGGGNTSTSSSKTDFFSTVPVSRYGSYVAKTPSR